MLVSSDPIPALGNESESLSEAATALTALQKVVKQDKELDRSVSELRNYVQNARHLGHIESQDSQLAALFPVRSWVHWMPHAPYQLAKRDPCTILVVAYYETVKLAMQSLCPTIDTPLAMRKRADCLELMCQTFVSDHGAQADELAGQEVSSDITSAQITREHVSLVQAPEHYIRLYRAKHAR